MKHTNNKSSHVIDSIIDSGLIEFGSHIVLGLSGGPDSLCLLHSLCSIAETFEIEIIPVHINHGLRKEADEEAENVERICEKLGLDCITYSADCQKIAYMEKVTLEEAGRIIRYDIFDMIAEEIEQSGVDHESIFIAVAHNADDQGETILFRLLRGTGPTGLQGMSYMRRSSLNYKIIRPLLDISRKEIEAYIKNNKLKPNFDSSNESSDYTRNKIRNELIPYLENEFNPNVKEALIRYGKIANEDNQFMDAVVTYSMNSFLSLGPESEYIELKIDEIVDDHISLQKRLIRNIFEIMGIEDRLTYEIVENVIKMMRSENPSASMNLPEGNIAKRDYDRIIFYHPEVYKCDIKTNNVQEINPRIILMKDFIPSYDGQYASFDFDLFNEAYPGRVGDIVLRNRKPNDYIAIKNGNKKIQNYMVDAKISKDLRDNILMAAIDDEILWVLPSSALANSREKEKGRFSSNYHINDTTQRVLLIEINDSI